MAAPSLIAIAVVLHDGRVLIGQRPPDVPLPNLWEFPGGKVAPGEAPEAAAARECREETALDVRITGSLDEVQHTYAHGVLRLCFFSAEPINPAQAPQEPFLWAPLADLPKYVFPPANAAVLKTLQNRLA